MKISEQEVQQYLARKNWLTATIQQIQKDLSWQNLELPLIASPSIEELHKNNYQNFSPI